ncbi:MAG TPA: Gfo/Idh/MocA family oxidoreductase [Candidatus Binatus sp.]|nr:Gfo/Idh/MocA family oxidoreductase [Candidatus Binatus sp.]
MIRLGFIGYGYWGPHLLGKFLKSDKFDVRIVAEASPERLALAQRALPDIRACRSSDEIIQNREIDAIAIATPVRTHYPLARAALMAGKHVLVEKPLAHNVEAGKELVEIAERLGLTLMVDHVLLFTGAVQTLRELKVRGELGTISYIDSMRVNLGLFQPDVNVLWDLAPHDLSVIDHLLEEEPVHVEATGYAHVNPQLPDIAYVTMFFPSQVVAHLNLSWMSPVKVRRFAIGGSRKMVVWDDLNVEERIKIYNSGISFQPDESKEIVMPFYRIGDIFSPRVKGHDALEGIVDHFAEVIAGKTHSITSGEHGLRMLRILETAQNRLDAGMVRSQASTPAVAATRGVAAR